MFVEMEFVKGGNLREWLQNKKPDQSDIRLTCFGILLGISHLHTNGIIHCDLKLENIMIREDGTPVILDFDVSKDTHQKTLTLATTPGR